MRCGLRWWLALYYSLFSLAVQHRCLCLFVLCFVGSNWTIKRSGLAHLMSRVGACSLQAQVACRAGALGSVVVLPTSHTRHEGMVVLLSPPPASPSVWDLGRVAPTCPLPCYLGFVCPCALPAGPMARPGSRGLLVGHQPGRWGALPLRVGRSW